MAARSWSDASWNWPVSPSCCSHWVRPVAAWIWSAPSPWRCVPNCSPQAPSAAPAPGFPIAYHIHAGNTVDAKTLQQMAQDFRQRFQVDHCLVVGDSGLLSKDNTDKLEQLGVGYLLGMGARVA
jgi:hypothetical protein